MKEVSYKGQKRYETYYIYDVDEASDRDIVWHESWLDAQEPGDWVLTDDGFVVQVINLGRKDGELVWIRTCTGSFTRRQSLTTEERECRWTFNGKYPGSAKTRPNVIFARLVAHGMDLTKAYLQTHPGAKNPANARSKAYALLENEKIQKIVAEELGDILKKLDLNKEYVLAGYKALAEKADSDSVRLSSLNSLSKVVGLFTEKRETKRLFLGISEDDLDAVEKIGAPAMEIPAEIIDEEDEMPVSIENE